MYCLFNYAMSTNHRSQHDPCRRGEEECLVRCGVTVGYCEYEGGGGGTAVGGSDLYFYQNIWIEYVKNFEQCASSKCTVRMLPRWVAAIGHSPYTLRMLIGRFSSRVHLLVCGEYLRLYKMVWKFCGPDCSLRWSTILAFAWRKWIKPLMLQSKETVSGQKSKLGNPWLRVTEITSEQGCSFYSLLLLCKVNILLKDRHKYRDSQ